MPRKSKFSFLRPLTAITALSTLVQALIAIGLFFLGFFMLIWGFSGKINFGPYGDVSHFNARIYMILTLAVLSSTHLFVATNWKRRILGFLAIFIGSVLILIGLGSYYGFLSATESGNGILYFSNIFIPFSVDMVAVGDLTVGLNIKLITDSCIYFIHGMIIFILVIQIIYAEGSGEFIKAMLEAICVAVVMIIFGSGGGIGIAI